MGLLASVFWFAYFSSVVVIVCSGVLLLMLTLFVAIGVSSSFSKELAIFIKGEDNKSLIWFLYGIYLLFLLSFWRGFLQKTQRFMSSTLCVVF